MTVLPVLPVVADIVVPPPPPSSSHTLLPAGPLPYIVLAAVAIGTLWCLRKRSVRNSNPADGS